MDKLVTSGPQANYREDDAGNRVWFRSDRIFKDNGSWYFQTREGTLEGPFHDRSSAEDRLESYIKVMKSGWMPVDSELELSPTAEK